MQDMTYHVTCVARGLHRSQGTAWLVADMPYGSYAQSVEQAMRNACALMQAGAHMVKLVTAYGKSLGVDEPFAFEAGFEFLKPHLDNIRKYL